MIDIFDNLKDTPRFYQYPEGFDVNPAKLNMTGWQGSFVIEIGQPSKDASGEAFDILANLAKILCWYPADTAATAMRIAMVAQRPRA